MEKGFFFDASRCVACYSCVVACQDQNDFKDSCDQWRNVLKFEYGTYPEVSTISISISCMHCGNPPCVKICPTKAITKKREDGIVIVNQERCIGCKICLTVCPFGAPTIGRQGKMSKCNYCLSQTALGFEPACVKSCPFGALYAGSLEDLKGISTKIVARRMVIGFGPFFLSKTLFSIK